MRANTRGALDDYLADRRSAELTLLDVLLDHGDVDAARSTLEEESRATSTRGASRATAVGSLENGTGDGPGARSDPMVALIDLLDRNRAGCEICLRIAERAPNMDAGRDVASLVNDVRAYFDGAASLSVAASVALYSFGNEALLDRATAEVVALLEGWALLRPTCSVLDVGSGSGRFARALSGSVANVVGVDVAARMIEIAKNESKKAGLTNIAFALTSGRDLCGLRDATFDLALAVDSVPYMATAGDGALIDDIFGELARLLKPRGELVIVGYSYRANADADRDDVAVLAAAHGFRVLEDGTNSCPHANGLVFRLRRDR